MNGEDDTDREADMLQPNLLNGPLWVTPCAAHGLCNSTASRLAEMGCTEQEIMSIKGHRTSKEIARYAIVASQKKWAERAVGKMTAKKVAD